MERDKALDMAVGQIEKQYGKGAVMRLGDQANQKIASIPTGAISLDLALGVGGIPRGRVTEIYGPEASGKCLVAGTYVWTDHGLETIEEVFARCGQSADCASRITDVGDQGVRAVNEHGDLEGVAALTHNNRQPVVRLRLRTGRTVEVTRNHPLRVVGERGVVAWRRAGAIRPGDIVVSAAFGAEEAAEGGGPDGEGLDEDEAVRLGYRVAGQVPHCVRTAGAKLQRAFLSALFEAGGWIDGGSTIGWASASEHLAREVQLLLLGLGVPASLGAASWSEWDPARWTVTIDPAGVGRFVDEVGFRSERRQRQAERLPGVSDAHRYLHERVEEVEDAGVQPTFDLMLPRTHSFLANGVLSHNTTVALHVAAEAQRAGGIAAFIDAEHALDPGYAKALGVDTEELLVSQPDTGEQALEIADMLVRSGAVDVIVIDSVAALTPKAEIEGEMGDTHVGLQARLMSQALRKLSGTLHRSRTSAVFINQLREKVGVMFGSPETTPGGRALKFYSSVRLDVRRIESLKDGNDAVGNRVRVKVVKNKCVAAGTRVVDAATGQTHVVEEVVANRRPITVWAADKRGKLHQKPVTGWFDQGEQDVLALRLADATTIRVTPDHLMLTDRGWRPAGELEVGDVLARPRVGTDGQLCTSPRCAELPESYTAPVLRYLQERGATAREAIAAVTDGQSADAAALSGHAGLRRDRVRALAELLDSGFLWDILDEDVFYDDIERIDGPERVATYDIEVADLHNFVAEDVVVHNCAPPFRQAEFDIMYGHGISREGALLDLGVDHGVVKKAGAWYTYDGEQLGQGRENAKKFLAEHDDVTQAITKQLHEQLGLAPTDVTGDDAVEDADEGGGPETV